MRTLTLRCKSSAQLFNVETVNLMGRETSVTWLTFLIAADSGPIRWSELEHILFPTSSSEEDRVLAQGVREAIIRAFGDFLLIENSLHPFVRNIAAGVYQFGPDATEEQILQSAQWRDTQRRVAYTLARIVDYPGHEKNDPKLLKEMKSWWIEHQNDPLYEIRWSDKLPDLYSFTVARASTEEDLGS